MAAGGSPAQGREATPGKARRSRSTLTRATSPPVVQLCNCPLLPQRRLGKHENPTVAGRTAVSPGPQPDGSQCTQCETRPRTLFRPKEDYARADARRQRATLPGDCPSAPAHRQIERVTDDLHRERAERKAAEARATEAISQAEELLERERELNSPTSRRRCCAPSRRPISDRQRREATSVVLPARRRPKPLAAGGRSL